MDFGKVARPNMDISRISRSGVGAPQLAGTLGGRRASVGDSCVSHITPTRFETRGFAMKSLNERKVAGRATPSTVKP